MNQNKTFRAELHVHTVLSPCAEVEMIPPLIIQEAVELGINLLAITDHNSTANIQAVQKAAKGSEVFILPGMELQTREEVHLLCLFDTIEQAETMQLRVNQTMPALKNRPDFFGEQFVVDETGDFIRREDSLLLTSSSLSIKQACDLVIELEGLIIPAHVNRKAFGLLPTLGFIPPELDSCKAMEISRHINPDSAVIEFPQLDGRTLIQSGDVHRLNEFLGASLFNLYKPSIKEISMAFQKIDGRNFKIDNSNL
ncbi:MAG TPA: PHP domain-containing protein [Leptolinea sp.]